MSNVFDSTDKDDGERSHWSNDDLEVVDIDDDPVDGDDWWANDIDFFFDFFFFNLYILIKIKLDFRKKTCYNLLLTI